MPIDNEQDDGLTPEERAALGDDDGAATDTNTDDAEAQAAKDADAAAKATEDAAEDAKATDAAAAATEAAAAEPAAADATQQSAPILVAQPTADAQAKLTEIEAQKEALLTQFDEGDITGKDYQKQLNELSKQERKIEFEIHEANLAAKLEHQRMQNDWDATCNAFVAANPVYKEMPWAYKELDAKIRELANHELHPETANWSGQKFLDEAHKVLKAQYKFPEAAADKGNDSQRQQRELPPNLAKVPAANLEDTNGGRFAVLDRLANSDPIAYEEALNKLPAAERDAYLAA